MGKFCLEDNDFTINVRDTFERLRENHKLFDVTLATDDGQHVQAHKIILATGSYFFNDMFMKSNLTNMLVYLKGIGSKNLEHIMEFLYTGVTSIPQEDLKQFLDTGKELGVKGLQFDVQNSPSKLSVEKKECNSTKANLNEEGSVVNAFTDCHIESTVSDDPSSHTTKDDTIDNIADFVIKTEEIDLQVNINEEFDDTGKKLEQMIGKIEGGWNCNVCGRISTKKQNMRHHVETHIEGISHKCRLCSKTFNVKRYLQQHISNMHSDLFSCEFCGKSEMNRGRQYKHKCQKPLPRLSDSH